jgi:A/G-specific adenine glycosylase
LLWLQQGDQVWVQQRPPRGIWASLWSWPEADEVAHWQALAATLGGTTEVLPPFVHVLTHVDWTLAPLRCRLPPDAAAPDLPGQWVSVDQALQMGLPAPVRRLLTETHPAG